MGKNGFTKYELNPLVMKAIEQLHFTEPTEIQDKVIPAILEGKNVIGESQTGSGKTHAYLLPLFQNLNTEKREVQFVVVAPTRELAVQLYDEVKKVIKYAGKESIWIPKLLVGGTDKQKVADQLKKPPHIVVGTPGRILDLVNANAISIYTAKTFVIDEADLMLDLGFIEEVDQLLVRSKKGVQLLAFSATIPLQLEHFLKRYLVNPYYVKVGKSLSPHTLEHRLIALRHQDISKLIIELSKVFQPYLAIIFTNGQELADDLAKSLQEKGLDVGLIHGGLSPRERNRTLKQIQDLRYQYVVSTDLASRGIDIKGVSHVINAHFPKEEDFYVHRVGRTARAGLEGMAISFYEDNDIELIEQLEKKGIKFVHTDVKNGEWIAAQHWNRRKKRKKTPTNFDREAWRRVKKPKKVKPGYRKKMKKEQEAIKKQLIKKSRRKKR